MIITKLKNTVEYERPTDDCVLIGYNTAVSTVAVVKVEDSFIVIDMQHQLGGWTHTFKDSQLRTFASEFKQAKEQVKGSGVDLQFVDSDLVVSDPPTKRKVPVYFSKTTNRLIRLVPKPIG